MKFSQKLKGPFLRSLSGLTVNLSAAWMTLAFVTPNFSSLTDANALQTLTVDLGFAILFLGLTVFFEAIQK